MIIILIYQDYKEKLKLPELNELAKVGYNQIIDKNYEANFRRDKKYKISRLDIAFSKKQYAIYGDGDFN